MLKDVMPVCIFERCDCVPPKSDGSIGMKEGRAFITKLDPVNGTSLLPVNPLLVQQTLQVCV